LASPSSEEKGSYATHINVTRPCRFIPAGAFSWPKSTVLTVQTIPEEINYSQTD
jgi:hypothetical protein